MFGEQLQSRAGVCNEKLMGKRGHSQLMQEHWSFLFSYRQW